MLEDIRLHLHNDEDQQNENERLLAEKIIVRHKKNISSFNRYIPSLTAVVARPQLDNFSLFCNSLGQVNIVDYGTGRALYGVDTEFDIVTQFESSMHHCPHIDLEGQDATKSEENACTLTSARNQRKLPNKIDCLVVLGGGLVQHLKLLIDKYSIQNLIMYEPEEQFFHCSSMVSDWTDILATAAKKGTNLFLQIGKDGRDCIEDIAELQSHFNIKHAYFYKHYNHPVFDSLVTAVRSNSWQQLKTEGFNFDTEYSVETYLPLWAHPGELDDIHYARTSDKLTANLNAFRNYFPDIYAVFRHYTPKTWIPIVDENDVVNVIHKDNFIKIFGEQPYKDSQKHVKSFEKHPNRDGLILGYNGTKLGHYVHYQFVKDTQKLIADHEELSGELPSSVESLILFGLGLGYQFESLLETHSIDKVFLCEPNPDFFFASLYAIDWAGILQKIDDDGGRIYLNIGDDGTHLMRDLMKQFHAVGTYILNNTFFYQCYHNAALNAAIAQLREQLRIMISMGEYFDHAFYGISQTIEMIDSGAGLLAHQPTEVIHEDTKKLPVFIVGNGPSLDQQLEAIEQHQNNVILISCGTALQALYKRGIKPDFHAEVEQNRANFDWVTAIGDDDYLQDCHLLACNGIHPDTCELFKSTLICFKSGESSTVSSISVLGKNQFAQLEYAYPTVGNLAIEFTRALGFESVYLFGVDLGFISPDKHHSKLSGYYQSDGSETFDYASRYNTSLMVKGNFRQVVSTKHEFKVAIEVLERCIGSMQTAKNVYNCSDGAFIEGTQPLKTEAIIVLTSAKDKQTACKDICDNSFIRYQGDSFRSAYFERFKPESLKEDIDNLSNLISEERITYGDVHQLIEKQRESLHDSYRKKDSLLFYYMYGTVNYANAILVKLCGTEDNETLISDTTTQCLAKWRYYFDYIANTILHSPKKDFDSSAFRYRQRSNRFLMRRFEGCSLLVVTDSDDTKKAITAHIKLSFPWLGHCDFMSSADAQHYGHTTTHDFVINFAPSLHGDKATVFPKGRINTIKTVCSKVSTALSKELSEDGVLRVVLPDHINDDFDSRDVNGEFFTAYSVLLICLSERSAKIIIPRAFALDKESDAIRESLADTQTPGLELLEYGEYLAFGADNYERPVNQAEDRGKYRPSLQPSSLIRPISKPGYEKQLRLLEDGIG